MKRLSEGSVIDVKNRSFSVTAAIHAATNGPKRGPRRPHLARRRTSGREGGRTHSARPVAGAHLIRADVARLADIDMMVTETAQALGAADILVNNAGVYPRVKLLEMRQSDWDYVLDINLKAGMSRHHCLRQGAHGGWQQGRWLG